MYLGWFDPDKKKPPALKVAEAAQRYREKFGLDPEMVLVGPATDLDPRAVPMAIQTMPYIPANTFYVGEREETTS